MPKQTLIKAFAATTLLAGGAHAQTTLDMWYHGAGGEVEGAIIQGIVDDFNASQSDWNVVLESFPQASYNDSVTAAAQPRARASAGRASSLRMPPF